MLIVKIHTYLRYGTQQINTGKMHSVQRKVQKQMQNTALTEDEIKAHPSKLIQNLIFYKNKRLE